MRYDTNRTTLEDNKKTRKVRTKIQEHKWSNMKFTKVITIGTPHQILTPQLMIITLLMPLKKRKTIQPCVDISRKKVSPLEKLSHIAVCLHFQPERKLNWKTLREKRQRLEDLSDLEQKSWNWLFLTLHLPILHIHYKQISSKLKQDQTGLDRSVSWSGFPGVKRWTTKSQGVKE